MSNLRFSIFILTCFLFSSTSIIAQSGNTGMKFSNYGGLMGTFENPAFGAGQEVQWEAQIFNFNNTTEIQGIKFPWNALLTDGNFDFGDVLSQNSDRQFSFRNALEISGPGVFYNYKKKFSFGVTSRSRLFVQLNDANLHLADAIFSDDDFDFQEYGAIQEDYINLNVQAMSDIGVTGSAQVLNIKDHKLYAGASLRFYQGLGAFDFTGKNIDIDPNKILNSDSVVEFSADLQMNASVPVELDFLSETTSGELNMPNLLNPFSKASGNGIGGDIGVAYYGKLMKKKVRAGLSITDFGQINYKKGTRYSASFIANNVSIPVDSFENFPDSYDSIRSWASGYGVSIDTGSSSFVQKLPTRLNFYAEIELGLGFVIGLSSSANLSGTGTKRSTYGGYSAIIPRWQNKYIEVWAPISYNYFTKNIQTGFGARLAYLYFGSDNVLGLFSNESNGANVYLGLRIAGAFKKDKADKKKKED